MRVYLLTVDIGSGVDKRFGHSLLAISPGEDNFYESQVLNWGTFRFDDPWFAAKFLKGFLRYWVSEPSVEALLSRYAFREARTVWRDEIKLTPTQKTDLMALVHVALLPENQSFDYDFFEHNCATIPRDLLNQVLGGSLQLAFESIPANKTYRDFVREGLNENPLIPFALEVLLNDTVDTPLNRWQTLFHPLELRKALQEAGLLGPETVLVDRPKHPASGVWLMGDAGVIGCVWLSLVLVFWFRGSTRRFALSLYRGFEVLAGLFGGVFSTALLLFWAFSTHKVFPHNASLFLLWPVDFIYCFRGRGRIKLALSVLHVASALVCFVGYASEMIHQNLSQVWIGVGLPLVLFWGLRMFVPEKRSRIFGNAATRSPRH